MLSRRCCVTGLRAAVVVLAACLAPTALGQALTTAFTYQGALTSGGQPASGTFDMRFRLYDAATLGTQFGLTLCADNVIVTSGAFAVSLDFGAQFAGQQRFLEIDVRADTGLGCANSAGFTTLGPRQPLTATPNADFALSAANATAAANATNLNGQPSSFYTNAANIGTGTLPDARLSTVIPRTNSANVFSGSNTFQASPAFTVATGTSPFSVTSTTKVTNLNADQLDGLDSTAFALAGHTHDAAAITTGTLADARIASNIPRLSLGNVFSNTQTISMTTQTPLILTTTSTGGTWMNLANTSAGGRNWNFITTASGNSEGVGKLLLRDGTAGAVRMTLDTAGNVGIGTTSPGAPLDVQVAGGQSLQLRQDSGLVPGLNVNTTGPNAGIMRLRNSVEVWPSDDASRAGRVDIRNTGGSPTISLDGASGAISSANFPRAKVVQTYRDVRNGLASVIVNPGASPNIDTITVNIPGPGVLMLRGTMQVQMVGSVQDPPALGYLKLSDTTNANAVQLCETATGFDLSALSPVDFDLNGVLSVEWTVNVTAGTRSYTTSFYNSSVANAYYHTTTLSAVFIPGGL
jgi:hypothetical protein